MKSIYSIIISFSICLFVYCIFLSDYEYYSHSNSESEFNNRINCTSEVIEYEHQFRMGPVLLKFDKEWVIEENGKKYIRIGVDKRNYYPEKLYKDYDTISPMCLAPSTKSIDLVSESKEKKYNYSVNIYNIEIENSQLWVDLYYIITTSINSKNDIELELISGKEIFFYNPSTKMWWGKPNNNMQAINRMMFTDLYDTKKTLEDLKELYTRKVLTAKGFVSNIINTRTLILPSTKYFYEKIRVLQFSSTFYDMYVEKEKDEVKPKDEDKGY